MSVAGTTFKLGFRSLQGGIDHRLPVAVWFGQGQVTGDATGGVATSIIQVQHDGPASVEHSDLGSAAGGAADDVLVSWLSRNSIGEQSEFSIGGLQALAAGPSGAFHSKADTLFPARYFPISYGLESGDTTFHELQAQFVNTDGIIVTVNAWGYIWDRLAMRLAGGPFRPGDGGDHLLQRS